MTTSPKTPAAEPKGPVDVDPDNPRLTKALLTRYAWLRQRRRELDRESRAIKTEEEVYRDACISWLDERKATERKAHGFRIRKTLGRVSVPWKMHFIKQLGAAIANTIENNAPRSISLEIERIEE